MRLPLVSVELQTGHLCNNRCVFCISGRLTHAGKAPLLDGEEVKARISELRRSGAQRLTFLGGEPTAQPFFLDAVRHAVELGFEELVIFTNGSHTGRTDLLERVVALGGNYEWRFSFQGATQEAHERTTGRRGSFAQLVASLGKARAQKQKITVNMCLVAQNYESLSALPALLEPFGVVQLHLDTFHPDDIGEATEEEIFENIPRYSELVPGLEAVRYGLASELDLRFGNLPFCLAPHLSPYITHGGTPTETITVRVDGVAGFNDAWNKYRHKRRGKVKLESCASCVFDARCSGIAAQYLDKFGAGEFLPVIRSPFDPPLEIAPLLRAAVRRIREAAPFPGLFWRSVDLARGRRDRVEIAFDADGTKVILFLEDRGGRLGGGYRIEPESIVVSDDVRAGIAALLQLLARPGERRLR